MQFKFGLALSAIILLTVGCDGEPEQCSDIPEFSEQSIGEVYVTKYLSEEPINDIFELVFRVNFIPEETVIASSNRYANPVSDFSYSLFSNANATTCVEPYIRETVTEVNITSDADFDETYTAGHSLNDVFTHEFYVRDIEGSLYGAPLKLSGFLLSLRRLPSLDKIHTFQFELSFDSQKTFVLEVEDVVFE